MNQVNTVIGLIKNPGLIQQDRAKLVTKNIKIGSFGELAQRLWSKQ